MEAKARVTLGGEPLAATGPISWRIQAGTTPYITTFTVTNDRWQVLKGKIGKPLNLEIVDGRGIKTTIRDLYILHAVPGDGPKRTTFLVADKRWKWSYGLIARDYNIPRKSGDRTAKNRVPVENQVVIDLYDYKPYSLKEGKVWKAKEAVEDILELIDKETRSGGETEMKFVIESWPIQNEGNDGSLTLQGVVLRDSPDAALARLLSYIPGAEVYVDIDGFTRVFDGTDIKRAEQHFKDLPPITWDGEKPEFIDRKKVRPKAINIHYQREVEVLLEYEDDLGSQTSADPVRDEPYLENVIPTVDEETTVTEYDPVTGQTVTKEDVPPGTWVTLRAWLTAMDAVKPVGAMDWTFDTIKAFWMTGDLESMLGGSSDRGIKDLASQANVASRVQALRQHFRQTFRLNRRYMDRVRDIQAYRVAMIDPVTAARAPAAVWGQYCIIPSRKGRMAKRREVEDGYAAQNIDALDGLGSGFKNNVIQFASGPAMVSMVDRDQGIFRVEYSVGPYGMRNSILPSFLVDSTNQPTGPTRDLAQQDRAPMGYGMRVSGGSNGIFLKGSTEFKVLLTLIPAAPNNKKQFHVETVKAEDIKEVFREEFGIKDGEGPELDVFIPPGEVTARFAWVDDAQAKDTVGRLLGLNSDNPNEAGLVDDPETKKVDESQMLGFQIANQGREIDQHKRAVAAELLARYADSVQGTVATTLPNNGLWLRGNMGGATIHVAGAPSGKVNATHEFTGQQRPINAMAMLPDDVRQLVLGVLRFEGGDR